ncbi:hypothetical protein BDB00DRAFT_868433 [Zychaea mexicana]|uniref:uncharacterized protein n=1 Tax=Zychaea mexicana TaxID=64656 RepID=UPI0022FE1D96|nr:uncharacterized protein BDB00DRAFT_868433 [Zychaea mexicana]KAI9497390.1 hypothetical protein BDB00DRAFT_868433 [Zychaea mexicana]
MQTVFDIYVAVFARNVVEAFKETLGQSSMRLIYRTCTAGGQSRQSSSSSAAVAVPANRAPIIVASSPASMALEMVQNSLLSADPSNHGANNVVIAYLSTRSTFLEQFFTDFRKYFSRSRRREEEIFIERLEKAVSDPSFDPFSHICNFFLNSFSH